MATAGLVTHKKPAFGRTSAPPTPFAAVQQQLGDCAAENARLKDALRQEQAKGEESAKQIESYQAELSQAAGAANERAALESQIAGMQAQRRVADAERQQLLAKMERLQSSLSASTEGAPAPLELRPGDGPPHIRLDRAAEFLIGDRL